MSFRFFPWNGSFRNIWYLLEYSLTSNPVFRGAFRFVLMLVHKVITVILSTYREVVGNVAGAFFCFHFVFLSFLCLHNKRIYAYLFLQCLVLWSKQEKLIEVLVELPGKQSYFHCKNIFVGQRHCMNTANIFTVKINKSAFVFIINSLLSKVFPPYIPLTPCEIFLYGLNLVIIPISFLLRKCFFCCIFLEVRTLVSTSSLTYSFF